MTPRVSDPHRGLGRTQGRSLRRRQGPESGEVGSCPEPAGGGPAPTDPPSPPARGGVSRSRFPPGVLPAGCGGLAGGRRRCALTKPGRSQAAGRGRGGAGETQVTGGGDPRPGGQSPASTQRPPHSSPGRRLPGPRRPEGPAAHTCPAGPAAGGALPAQVGGGRARTRPRSPPTGLRATAGRVGGAGGPGPREGRGGWAGVPKKGPRWPPATSSGPPPRNKGLQCRAWGAAACGGGGRETFPAAGGGPGRRAGRALTSSMAATVWRHCAVRVVKLEAVGAL